MKVHTAQFVRDIPFFTGRRGSFNATHGDFAQVAGVATDRGLQFTRERPDGDAVLIERVCVPYENVLRWSPAPERRAKPADAGKTKQ